jgi:hypothetical protein
MEPKKSELPVIICVYLCSSVAWVSADIAVTRRACHYAATGAVLQVLNYEMTAAGLRELPGRTGAPLQNHCHDRPRNVYSVLPPATRVMPNSFHPIPP